MPAQDVDNGGIGDLVHLVQNQQDIAGLNSNLTKHLVDRVNLSFRFRTAGIDDMQQQISATCFFQRGTKRRDEMMWKVANKSDRVAQQNFTEVRQLPASRSCIHGREQLVFHQHIRPGKGSHQSTFAGVGVPNQRNCWLIMAK